MAKALGYGKDELSDCLDRYKCFREYQRSANQSISEYCAGFEQQYNRVKSKGVTLPPEVLAFELIRNARISSNEEKLVMTGLDFNQKARMHADAIKALKHKNPQPKQTVTIVHGGAGSGKSTVINILKQWCQLILQQPCLLSL